MPQDRQHGGEPATKDDLLRRFTEAISGLGPGELQGVLQQVLAAGAGHVDPFERPTPPSRRRPRRGEVGTYRVRIDLNGTKPPLWRRLEVASDLFLDDLHGVLQTAFGWTDSHLHRFGSGPDYYHHDTEYYLCPFEVEEGETGIPEDQVRLDEVLAKVGDILFYNYDFGDDWHHTIKLEAILPRDTARPRVVCTDGRRPGPAEDCGGIHGYELIAAATDPAHADHADAVAEYARSFGLDADPAYFRPSPFDLDEINTMLTDLGNGEAAQLTNLPVALDELVHAVRPSKAKQKLRRLIGVAALDRPVHIDADTAARMVHPYIWLLDRLDTDGITLTGAGYLPPAHVAAATAELGLTREWIGKGNRENQTLPVLHLRESAQKAGLLRKHRGKLLPTARGRAMATDPVALWWHLAATTPPRSTDPCDRQAGLILLIMIAAQATNDLYSTIAELLGAIGWMTSDGMPLTGSVAAHAAWDTMAVLRRVGAFAEEAHHIGRPERPTPDGITFARAALTTWPVAG